MASVADMMEAECGSSNPLTDLTRHLTEDLSRREEIGGHGVLGAEAPAVLSRPFPLHPADVFVEEFLASEERTRLAPETFQMNDLLREMLAIDAEEHRETMQSGPIRGPAVADIVARGSVRWAEEFLQSDNLVPNSVPGTFPQAPLDTLRLDEVTWMGGATAAGPTAATANTAAPAAAAASTFHASAATPSMDDATAATSATARTSASPSSSLHASAAEWTEQFEAANPEMTRSANQLFGTIEKPKFSNAEFLKFVNNFGGNGGGRVSRDVDGGDEIVIGGRGDAKDSKQEMVKIDSKDKERVEFSAAASSSSPSSSPSLSTGRQRASIADKWAAELEAETQGSSAAETGKTRTDYGQTSTADGDIEKIQVLPQDSSSSSNAFMEKLQREWEDAGARVDRDWFKTFEHATNRRDAYAVYRFDVRNPFLDFEGDRMEEGRRRWRRGDLANAILLFEAAVKEDPTNPEAWQLLGSAQAENEQEPSSIAALRKCVELAPGNLAAWMALAVSYTNESLYKQGCEALRRWFDSNPKYGHIGGRSGGGAGEMVTTPTPTTTTTIYSSVEHEEIQARFIEAVRETTARNEFDFELQSGLGVLFNISGEYDKAIDCFQAALKARPSDAPLWNRLGATLANGNRPEEAVRAYNAALQLSPGFVRCRYNLGIACLSLSAYRQAVEHLLTALKLQSAGIGPMSVGNSAGISFVNAEVASNIAGSEEGSPGNAPPRTSSMSENIWSTLRLTLSLMGRTDLLPFVVAKNMEELSRQFQVAEENVGA